MTVRLLVPFVVLCTALPASRARAQHLEFETTSVKPNTSADMRNARIEFLPGGRLVIQGLPLGAIVAIAYELPIESQRARAAPNGIR